MSLASTVGRKGVRCAIYTRKSTDEGLDQSFNTLDAQREACEAYVRSQMGEGWRALSGRYDDGGFSGGNMERPGLKRLLADVEAGMIDTIVVYKVDRLTRSLMDFAKIVERLDAQAVSFVSVTQAFNTTTSMGRLTLNVLLSFAQFEREVTGERIRDKVAASKARGMWMGGNIPLGYDLGERILLVNDAEAAQVRDMFKRYLELNSVPALAKQLAGEGIVSKRWISRKGNERGGAALGCGAIYYILQNRLYRGQIIHAGKTFEGDHEAIVPEELFEAVQQRLAQNRRTRKAKPVRAARCQLLGRVFDAKGRPMRPSFSYGRGGKLYRYYVEAAGKATDAARIQRIPAEPLERWLKALIGRFRTRQVDKCADPLDLVLRVEVHHQSTQIVLGAEALAEPYEGIKSLISRLAPEFSDERIVPDSDHSIRLIAQRQAAFRGGQRGNLLEATARVQMRTEKLLRAGHKLLQEHSMSPLDASRHSEALPANYQRQRRMMAVGLLAPDLQRAILEGRKEPLVGLLEAELPLAWSDQRKLFEACCPA